MQQVIIIGGGIGGLTTALFLHRHGIACRVYEAARAYRPLGVGINMLPHAMRELDSLGLTPALAARGVEAREFGFFNHHGQFIYSEPCGRHGGYDFPHFSIHRGDLHAVLEAAVLERMGPDAIVMGQRCQRVEQDGRGVQVFFEPDPQGGAGTAPVGPVEGRAAIACDGFHSAVRRQFYPEEAPPQFGGINMWRGVTRGRPFLSGASVTRIGAIRTGKVTVYPIRNFDDGTQLINWVCELERPGGSMNDWQKLGRLEDFIAHYADWRFEWLDMTALLERAEFVLEYPMVDRDPVSRWSFGRVTLLGDAAHPMYPRGGNGAAQSIIDARTVAGLLSRLEPPEAFLAYETERLAPTARIVRTNRTQPPDAIINLVEERTGGAPFTRLEDVISQEELRGVVQGYASVAGYDIAAANQVAVRP